jgi:ribosomal protein S18 acetylase RimI-like enzyme
MIPLLHNVFWHCLIGPQAAHAAGAGGARRYAVGFSPIVAFENPADPDLAALSPYCAPDEPLYCADWAGPVPSGWQLAAETTMVCMIWDGATPDDEAPDALPLHAGHAPQAVALAEVTHPGPFGPRTIELGEYFGCFDGQRLIAMAGERSQAGALHEISGVCTDPAFQGRGLARRLMLKLIARQRRRGETPFLHVVSSNTGAHGLYRWMGFRDHHETVVRVISRS